MRLRALISRKSPSPPKPSVVTRGLVEWFDFADGKGTETTLKSRVSDNVLTLTNFNFDANSGWTGKSLKFDGVNDSIQSVKVPKGSFAIICFSVGVVGSYYQWLIDDRRLHSGSIRIHFNENRKEIKTEQTHLLQSSDYYLKPNMLFEGNQTISFVSQGDFSVGGRFTNVEFLNCIIHSIKIYNVALTPEEITQNYEYEQSIDRTTITTYPLLQEQKFYGIGLVNQLSEEQKSTFRLSVDGTKFVAGLRYCEGLEVEEFTYSEIQVEMEKEEWSKIEEVQYV